MTFRDDLWECYEGRCFYCLSPTVLNGKTYDDRDWLLGRDHEFAQEHMTPVSRGGHHGRDNFLPSCRRCNTRKGSLTCAEYQFLCGLRVGDLNFQFAFMSRIPPRRDWLCCHSPAFERRMLRHNFQVAA